MRPQKVEFTLVSVRLLLLNDRHSKKVIISLIDGNHDSVGKYACPSFIRFRILKVTEIAIIYGKMTCTHCTGVGVAPVCGSAFWKCVRETFRSYALYVTLASSSRVGWLIHSTFRTRSVSKQKRWRCGGSQRAKVITGKANKKKRISFNAFSGCQENKRKKFGNLGCNLSQNVNVLSLQHDKKSWKWVAKNSARLSFTGKILDVSITQPKSHKARVTFIWTAYQ